jgi:hypothetical protein
MGLLVALGVVFTLLTWLRMRRLGPRRRRAPRGASLAVAATDS